VPEEEDLVFFTPARCVRSFFSGSPVSADFLSPLSALRRVSSTHLGSLSKRARHRFAQAL
jgi:hypothetical protein